MREGKKEKERKTKTEGEGDEEVGTERWRETGSEEMVGEKEREEKGQWRRWERERQRVEEGETEWWGRERGEARGEGGGARAKERECVVVCF